MKKLVFFVFLLAGILKPCFCEDTISCKIIFYWNDNSKSLANSYPVFINQTKVISIQKNSYLIYRCSPGEYTIKVSHYESTKLHLKLNPGETCYLRLGSNIHKSKWTTIPEFVVADSIYAYSVIQKGSLKEMDKGIGSLHLLEERIGLYVGYGAGLHSIPMITSMDGEEASISFGGGYVIGVEYSRELSRYTDIEADLAFQKSELQPYVEDVKISFQRVIISVSPSFVLPMNKDNTWRLKLAGGGDYYIGTHLNINCAKLSNGFDDKWDYSDPFGFHFSVGFEMNLSDKWSLHYGAKWYTVHYSFKSGEYYYPTDKDLKNPDGSGVDFFCGFAYHF